MPTDQWIQYGSFGLVAAYLVWLHWKAIPRMLNTHEAAVNTLVESFKAEAAACRNERMELYALAASERRQCQQARHDERDALTALAYRKESDRLREEKGEREG